MTTPITTTRQAIEAADWTLADLRNCNIERQAVWCPDQVPDLSFRGNELGGECGEAQNVIKKLERERHGWRGSRATIDDLAQELADVVICADLAAFTAGVDLMSAVKTKFDATSVKVGLPHRLARTLPIAEPVLPEDVADIARRLIDRAGMQDGKRPPDPLSLDRIAAAMLTRLSQENAELRARGKII